MLCYFQVYKKVSQLYIYVFPLSFFFFWFSSHIGHYRALSGVPCAIQQVLISYLIAFSSFEYIPRSGITRLYGNSVKFLRNSYSFPQWLHLCFTFLLTVLQGSSIFTSSLTLVIFHFIIFFIIVILMCVK